MKNLYAGCLLFLLATGVAFSQAQIDTASTLILDENQEAEFSYNEGLKGIRTKKYVEAVNYFNEAITKKANFYQAFNGRATAYLMLKDYSNAIKDYRNALKNKPKEPGTIFYNLGIAQQLSAQLDSSIVNFKKADAKGFKEAKVNYNIGLSYYLQKKYKDAITAYDKAILSDPNYADAYNDRASAKRQLNDETALDDYSKAIQISPKALYYENRGSMYRKLKLYGEAIDDYTIAIKLDHDFYLAYNNRGSAKYDKGDYSDAIDDYNKAISINPNYSPAFNNLGTVYYLTEQYKLALEPLNKAIKIDKDYEYAYFNRGNVKESLGDIPGALADWKKASELGLKFADKNISEYKK